jgi:hypothetical protein
MALALLTTTAFEKDLRRAERQGRYLPLAFRQLLALILRSWRGDSRQRRPLVPRLEIAVAAALRRGCFGPARRLARRRAVSRDFEAGLHRQQPRHTLAKRGLVVEDAPSSCETPLDAKRVGTQTVTSSVPSKRPLGAGAKTSASSRRPVHPPFAESPRVATFRPLRA